MVTQRPATADLGFASGGRRYAIAPGRPPWAPKRPANGKALTYFLRYRTIHFRDI
jgi:hypothetical protein